MAMSGYCDSYVTSGTTSGGNSYSGAYYRWSWTADNSTPGITIINWTLQGRGRTSSPTWLSNECHISLDGGVGQIYTMEWEENQSHGDGTNTSFNHNSDKSWRVKDGSFSIARTDASALTLNVTIYASIYSGNNTGKQTVTAITIDANPPQYAIAYNANGGSGTIAGGTKTYGTNYTVLANGFTAPSNTSASYTITLNGNGGTSPTAKTCTRTTAYSFNTWTLNSTSGTAYAPGDAYTTEAAATFYAKWKGTTSGGVVLGTTTRNNDSVTGYKVTYDGNGGTCSVAFQSATNIIQYTFSSWNSNKSGTGTSYNGTSSYGFDANTTLYAQWSSSTTKGSTTLPVAGECTRTGYTCIGWATSKSATTPAYSPGASYQPTKDVTLYAVWQPKTYDVNYNANGGDGTMTKSVATYGAAFRTKQNAFTREGYQFNGWNEAADGSDVIWALTSNGVYESGKDWTWSYDKSITLYAQWTYSVRSLIINPNGGLWNNTSESTTISQDYGTTFTLTNPIRAGYTFVNWSLSGGGSLSNSTYTFGAENGTVTATWSANSYSIVFDANGGAGSMSPLACTYDSGQNLPNNTFTRQGYSFLGWSTSKNATTATYANQAQVQNLTTSDAITLYAVWEGYDYTIIYYANDGTDNASISAHKVGVVSLLSTPTFNREGYSFLGWSTSATGAPEYSNGAIAPADLVTADNDIINLYAIWSEKSPWTLCSVGFFAPTSATNSTLKWWTI